MLKLLQGIFKFQVIFITLGQSFLILASDMAAPSSAGLIGKDEDGLFMGRLFGAMAIGISATPLDHRYGAQGELLSFEQDRQNSVPSSVEVGKFFQDPS